MRQRENNHYSATVIKLKLCTLLNGIVMGNSATQGVLEQLGHCVLAQHSMALAATVILLCVCWLPLFVTKLFRLAANAKRKRACSWLERSSCCINDSIIEASCTAMVMFVIARLMVSVGSVAKLYSCTLSQYEVGCRLQPSNSHCTCACAPGPPGACRIFCIEKP